MPEPSSRHTLPLNISAQLVSRYTTHDTHVAHDTTHDTRHKSAHGVVWAERNGAGAWMCEDEFGEVKPGLPFGESHDVELLRDLDGDGLLLVAHHKRVRLVTRLPASRTRHTTRHTTRSDKHSGTSAVERPGRTVLRGPAAAPCRTPAVARTPPARHPQIPFVINNNKINNK